MYNKIKSWFKKIGLLRKLGKEEPKFTGGDMIICKGNKFQIYRVIGVYWREGWHGYVVYQEEGWTGTGFLEAPEVFSHDYGNQIDALFEILN